MQQTRRISKYLHKDRLSKVIRQRFLDYFVKEKNHVFIRSSPVVPYCDPTVAFVNAGMNQFKGIFLGTLEPEYKNVVNSQKCVRVGGKHNDLNVVGTDGYHHTFFEMLGNWSFGDYFKKDACSMAWNLLTEDFKLDKSRMYVTYFNGDEKLGLKPDLETYDIWKSIGVPQDRILPFGLKDNFWEMGVTGPCGPCTEIHYDYLGTMNRFKYVNKNLPDLIELWNLVFIEYNRNDDGTLTSLPIKHIDTGMGFERLTSVMQGVQSNYETDIFTSLFSAVNKICPNVPKYGNKYGENDWNLLDTSYRTFSDHCRMVTVCLADGMVPEQNQKLRRIMRRAFLLSENVFKKNGLLKEMTNYVVENLGCVYPEMERNIKLIHQIVNYEEDVYYSIRETALTNWQQIVEDNPKLANLDIIEMPGLVAAYKEIVQSNVKMLGPEFSFKLYDTYGLDKETITAICFCLNLKFDAELFENEMEMFKQRTKESFIFSKDTIQYQKLLNEKVPKTDDSFKYNYKKHDSNYIFEDIKAKLLKIIAPIGDFVENIEPNLECNLILDKTSLYHEAGGQTSDLGTIEFPGSTFFNVHDVQNHSGYILHKGYFSGGIGKVNEIGEIIINSEIRLNSTLNHTATHLLNAAIKRIKGATCQKSSKVTKNYLNLDVTIFETKLTLNDLAQIENDINEIIKQSIPVKVKTIDSQYLLSLDNVTLIPGEIYPDHGIRLIEIVTDNFISREPCCGTHAINTKDLSDFCIINYKSLGRSASSIIAVTGVRANCARKNAEELLDNIEKLHISVDDYIDKPEVLQMAVMTMKRRLNYDADDDFLILPYIIKMYCTEKLNEISKGIKDTARNSFREFVEIEMQNAIQTKMSKGKRNNEYLVHYLESSLILETVPLQKATKLCQNLPVLVVSYSENTVKARCCVPKEYVTEEFNAEKWLGKLSSIFKAQISPPKGQNANYVCNMKERKVNILEWDGLLKEGIKAAHNYATEHL